MDFSRQVKECSCHYCAWVAQAKLIGIPEDNFLNFVTRCTSNGILERQSQTLCRVCSWNHVSHNASRCTQCDSFGFINECSFCNCITYSEVPSVVTDSILFLRTGALYDQGSGAVICDFCVQENDINVDECHQCSRDIINTTEDGFYPEELVGRWIAALNDEGETVESVGVFCQDCYSDNYSRCYHCGQHVTVCSTRTLFGSNTSYCYSCLNRIDAFQVCEVCNEWYSANSGSCQCYVGVILEYGYRPRTFNRFRSLKQESDKQSVFYGVELEASFAHSAGMKPKATKEALSYWEYLAKPFMYAKVDGTITDGVEFVTHPFTWRHFQENEKGWAEWFSLCQKLGFSGDNSKAGMHIHVSRKTISGTRLYSILRFIHGNPFLMEHIGRRAVGDGTNMGQFAPISETQKGIVQKASGKWDAVNARKYNAVNLKNSETIELRFFKGVRTYEQFRRNLEFTRALVEFSKISGMNIWPHTFARFVLSKPKTYPVLTRTFVSIFGREV